jgi:putative monooxygenase
VPNQQRRSDLVVSRDEVTPNHRRGGDIRVLLSPSTVGASSGFLGVLALAPDEDVAEHYHPYSEEFLYVVHGAITVTLDGVDVPLTATDALLVPIGVRHRVRNGGDGPACAVFVLTPLAPEPRLGHVDTEPLVNPDIPGPEVGANRPTPTSTP